MAEGDKEYFLRALKDAAGPRQIGTVDLLVRLHSDEDTNYRRQVLEAVRSKGAFQDLAKTFMDRKDQDQDGQLARFLQRPVGSRSGLSKEEVESFL